MSNVVTSNLPAYKTGTQFKGRKFEVLIGGVPKNFATTEIFIYLRSVSQTGPIKKKLSTGEGITRTNGNLKFQIDPFHIALAPGKYYFDVLFKDAEEITCYIQGTWEITNVISIPE